MLSSKSMRLTQAVAAVQASVDCAEDNPYLSSLEVDTAVRFGFEFNDTISVLRGVDHERQSPQAEKEQRQRERQIWTYWIFDHTLPCQYVAEAMLWSWEDSIFLPLISDWKALRLQASDQDKERIDGLFTMVFDQMALDPADPMRIR